MKIRRQLKQSLRLFRMTIKNNKNIHMNKYCRFILGFIFTYTGMITNAQEKTTITTRVLKGKIGSIPVGMVLKQKEKESKLSGYYFYETKGQPIRLLGEIAPSKVTTILTAYLDQGMEKFLINYDVEGYEGKWTDKDNKTTLPVFLTFTGREYTQTLFQVTDSIYYEKDNTRTPRCDYKVAVTWPISNDIRSAFIKKQLMAKLDPQKKVNVTWMPGILEALKKNYQEEFLTSLKNISKSDISGSAASFNNIFDAKHEIEFHTDKMATIHHLTYTYTGGAHGSTEHSFSNLDLQKMKPITLQDMFTPLGIQQLPALIDKKFRTDRKLKPSASLKEAGLFNDKINSASKEYFVTPLGIGFFYNQYEIAPYAAGAIEVFLPFSTLQTYILPAFKKYLASN